LTTPAHGIISGPLAEVHSDRIVIGLRTLHLRAGESCDFAIGTGVEVTYTERDGRKNVNSITPLERRPARPR
jgi:hypothetical protein